MSRRVSSISFRWKTLFCACILSFNYLHLRNWIGPSFHTWNAPSASSISHIKFDLSFHSSLVLLYLATARHTMFGPRPRYECKYWDSHTNTPANYLSDLRNNRPTRPNGARPLPSRPLSTSFVRQDVPPRAPSALSQRGDVSLEKPEPHLTPAEAPPRCASAMSSYSQSRTSSATDPFAGRPLVPEPNASNGSRKVSPTSAQTIQQMQRSSSGTYRESGQRWLEKEEARSLRDALRELDMQGEEQKVHAAARDEAAELVFKHQHPNAPENDPNNPYYNPDTRKAVRKSWNASADRGKYGDLGSRGTAGSHRSTSSASDGAASKADDSSVSAIIAGYGESLKSTESATEVKAVSTDDESKSSIGSRGSPEHRRRSSSGSKRRISSLFKNPADKIYEEPEEAQPVQPKQEAVPETVLEPKKPSMASRGGIFASRTSPLKVSTRNALPWLNRANRTVPERSNTEPLPTMKLNRTEIYKNPPTQSRNPAYTRNDVSPTPPRSTTPAAENEPETTPTKNGIEIRSDDIRAATSMRRSDRSPNLPRPTAVSDLPGRPIVSFDPTWKPVQEKLKDEEEALSRPSSRGSSGSLRTGLPRPAGARGMGTVMSASAPIVPTIGTPIPAPTVPEGYERMRHTPESSASPIVPVINVPDAPVPTINVPEINVPTINAPESPAIPTINLPSQNNVPSINVSGSPTVPAISLPDDQSAAPCITTTPAIPTINAPDTNSGPSSSSRPLPQPTRGARPTKHQTPTQWYNRSSASCALCALPISGRIVTANSTRFHPECFTCHHCNTGLECVAFYPEPEKQKQERLDKLEAEGILSEADHVPRFYCALDFHEFFSPRCRSCKTPIEGEVIIACGGEWHAGHFFCAECGDVSLFQTIGCVYLKLTRTKSPSHRLPLLLKRTVTHGALAVTLVVLRHAVQDVNVPSSTKLLSLLSTLHGMQTASCAANVVADLEMRVDFSSERLRSRLVGGRGLECLGLLERRFVRGVREEG